MAWQWGLAARLSVLAVGAVARADVSQVPRVGGAERVSAVVVGTGEAGWVRLDLGGTELSGDVMAGTGGYVVVRSVEDGAEQRLDAEALAQWGGTSAYFNGGAVEVELWSVPGAGESRLVIAGTWSGPAAGNEEWNTSDDLCGNDERVGSADNRVARLMNGTIVCTTWMFDDFNRSFISAGHCAPAAGSVVQFNVPRSGADGSLRHPGPEDQFAVDLASVQKQTSGPNNDWSYFGVLPNSVTGLTPAQQYGAFFTLASGAPAVAGQTIRVTGYGQVSMGDLSLSFAQTTGTGAYTLVLNNLVRYNVDTTGGNSGSAVVDVSTGQVIGIHYFAGCATGGNQGVNVANANLRAALAAPLGVCRTGRGQAGGMLFAVGDLQNNFGTVSVAPNNFAGLTKIGRWWRGMVFESASDQFLAIDSTRALHRITRAGVATVLGQVAGPAGVLAGLAYVPQTGRVLAMEPAVGQLWSIDPGTLAASRVGGALGGNIVALEYEPVSGMLLGVERGSGGAKLFSIDPATGARTLVGSLSGLTTQIGDIALDPNDRQLYFLNTTTGAVGRIDPATAAVTLAGTDLGPTNGVFGSSYGLAFALPARACVTDYNADGAVNLDDLSDFITDFYAVPAIPGGIQPAAPTLGDRLAGYGRPCVEAPDAPWPYAVDAYRVGGYRVGYSGDGLGGCPIAPGANFPTLDNVSDFITAFYSPC
jgi:hypothetical protein